MNRCPACDADVAAGARFCSECGAPQPGGTGPAAAPAPTEERRFVTILFVDLVGFTERSDMADPEDVRTTLVPYHGRAKEIIERYGGTLDKFIGDAVMGVFGAPVAHEDDPARAVLASLRILAAIDELREDDPALQVRVAVNSGEAVVTSGTGPRIGEAVAGDVVNTASRMQSLAPPGGLVIGPITEQLVRERFVTEALPPVMVKGKSEPLRVWRVTGEREASTGTAAVEAGFVGRSGEMGLLRERFERALADGRARVVAVVGDPGIGKSRFVEEFRRAIGDVRWLEGRCVPYGEVSAFEPVAMVLREAAAITPADDPDAVRVKIIGLAHRAGADPGWVTSRLGPIVGLPDVPGEAVGTVHPAEVADAFSAALLPADRPTVLVLQDLHWAEEVMFEFLQALARRAVDLPVLLLLTARPEVSDRAAWPPTGATTIRLPPLGHDDTATLVRSLLAGAADGVIMDATVMERAGGNPLYAVEFARMLIDRGAGAATGAAGAGAAGAGAAGAVGADVPESVRAVISARIDAIPRDLRAVVLLASVAGIEVWPELIAHLHGVPTAHVRDALGDLAGRDVVRRSRSTLAGHEAFGFAHDLIREVAYARIPRRRRARLHLDVAEWLASASGERADERSELLAGHFERAVEYGLMSRQDDVVARARTPAIRWLLVAADRALRVDTAGSFALSQRALDLEPADPAVRAEALVGSARAGRRSFKLGSKEVLSRYEEALEIERRLGDEAATARVLTRLASQLGVIGETTRARAAITEAVELLDARPPSPELANAYAFRAELALFSGRPDDAMADAERALAALGPEPSDSIAVMALHIRGDARCSKGDRGGLDDLGLAMELSARAQNLDDMVTSESYLSDWLLAYEGPAAALPHLDASIELAERSGVLSQGGWAKAQSLFVLYELGEPDAVLARAEEILAVGRDRLDSAIWLTAQAHRAKVLVPRGLAAEVPSRAELFDEARGAEDDLQVMSPVLLSAARLALADGETDEAAGHLRRFEELTRDAAREFREASLMEVVELCVEAGALGIAQDTVDASEGDIPHHRCTLLSARAALLEAGGGFAEAAVVYAEAAAAWDAFGTPHQARLARTGAARCSDGV